MVMLIMKTAILFGKKEKIIETKALVQVIKRAKILHSGNDHCIVPQIGT